MEQIEETSPDPAVAALAAALRIFAARGKAIREAQAQQQNLKASPCDIAVLDGVTDQQQLSGIEGTALDKLEPEMIG